MAGFFVGVLTATPHNVVQLFESAIKDPRYSLYDEFEETNQVAETSLTSLKFVAVKQSRNPTHKHLLGKGKRWRACPVFCNVLAIATIKRVQASGQCWQNLAELLSHHVASVGEGWLVEQNSNNTVKLSRQVQIQQV